MSTPTPKPSNVENKALWNLDQNHPHLKLLWEDRTFQKNNKEKLIHTAIITQNKIQAIINAYEKDQLDGKERTYDFSYCWFKEKTNFNTTTFSGKAYFNDAKFLGESDFWNTSFSGAADFRNAEFSGKADFSDAEFSGEADFHNAEFSGMTYFNNAKFLGESDFWNTSFSGEADFRNAEFSKNAEFRNAEFSKESDFRNAEFSKKASFMNAKFSEKADFHNAEFSKNASFMNAEFSGEAGFILAKFSGNANFMNLKFLGEASFRNAKFSGNANFMNAKFSGETNFMNAEFSEIADFRGVTFEKDANFENAHFLAEPEKNSVQEKLCADFSKTKFFGQGFFYDITCEKLPITFRGAHIAYSLHFLGAKIAKVKEKEDARIIKHEFQKIGNSLEAMKWEQTELELYRVELKVESGQIKKTLKKSKDEAKKLELKKIRLEQFTLWFQQKTTDYGSNWWQGTLCIIGITLSGVLLFNITHIITYIIHFKKLGCLPLGKSFQLFFTLINPTHNFYEIFDKIFAYEGNRAVFFAIDLITRLFNSILIFQTIRAFRKFSRK